MALVQLQYAWNFILQVFPQYSKPSISQPNKLSWEISGLCCGVVEAFAFWHRLVVGSWHFRTVYRFYLQGMLDLYRWIDRLSWNVTNQLPTYATSHPRRVKASNYCKSYLGYFSSANVLMHSGTASQIEMVSCFRHLCIRPPKKFWHQIWLAVTSTDCPWSWSYTSITSMWCNITATVCSLSSWLDDITVASILYGTWKISMILFKMQVFTKLLLSLCWMF